MIWYFLFHQRKLIRDAGCYYSPYSAQQFVRHFYNCFIGFFVGVLSIVLLQGHILTYSYPAGFYQ